MIKCKYCDKELSTLRQLSGHLGHCKKRRVILNLPNRKEPWNKGKTKENNAVIKEIARKMKGRKIIWKDKVSKTMKEKYKKGYKNWNDGYTKLNHPSLLKSSLSIKKIRNSPEFKQNQKEWLQSLTSAERRKKWATYGNAGHKQSEESIRKNSEKNSQVITEKILQNKIKRNGWARHGVFVSKSGVEHQYDSSYELERMKWLDENGYIFKRCPFFIPYFFKGRQHRYIPDLLIFDKENANIWVEEIKSEYTLNKDKEKNKAKFEAAKEFCKLNGIEFHVYNTDEYEIYKNIEFDEIESIEEVGEEDFYGFCSPIHKNIIVDDVIHHNSGKDTLAIHFTMYAVYVLLCCKNPYNLFLGIDKNSTIDIINVAYNAKQASSVFFFRLVNCVKNWKWLRNKYKYIESGKSKKTDKKYENQEVVNIKAAEILFPKNILAVSMHSQQEAAEGKNTLIWILDEISAFSDKNKKSNGYEMFQTLKTSSYTRFEKKGKGFVISWPRYKGDPIQTLCEQYKDDPHAYVDIASTFDVKPKKCFSSEWTYWNGVHIPVTFLEEFEKNPEDSKRKYLCQPGESSDPFFTEEEKLLSAVDHSKKPMFDVIEGINKVADSSFIIKRIKDRNYNIYDTSFVLAGDIGLTYDYSTLSMWHRVDRFLGNNQSISYYEQDWLLYWKPDQEKKIKVDINNIQEIIFSLIDIYKVPIAGVYFDHYNSAQLIQSLLNRGINASAYTLTLQDFFDIRVKIYSGLVKFLDVPEQTREMQRLTKDNQGKPDHPYKEHDDIWRANCLAIMGLSGFKNQDTFTNDDGTFIKKRKAAPGLSTISGEQEAIGGVSAKMHSNQADDIFNALNDVNNLN